MVDCEPLIVAASVGRDCARIFLRGELDLATASRMREQIDDVLANGGRRSLVVLDMAGVDGTAARVERTFGSTDPG